MGPLALTLYNFIARHEGRDPEAKHALNKMRASAYFLIDLSFLETCRDIAAQFPPEDFTDKMPAEDVFIEVEHPSGWRTGYMLGPDATLGGVIAMSSIVEDKESSEGYRLGDIGHWRPRTCAVGITNRARARYPKDASEEQVMAGEHFNNAVKMAELLSTMMELLCEPRLVERSVPSRADRKRAARALGEAGLPTTWARVTWNIGEKTVSKNQKADEGHGRPYHMVRGHWRNYGDRQTASAERRPGRPGWWTWIETHHAGNPAFGIVGHRYDPKLHPEKSALVVRDLIAGRIASSKADPGLFY